MLLTEPRMSQFRLGHYHVLALTLIVMTCQASPARAQDKADKVLAAIRKHFEKVPAEAMRNRRLTIYGETLSGTAPFKADLEREIALYKDVAEAGLLKNPTNDVFSLGHNLIIHD